MEEQEKQQLTGLFLNEKGQGEPEILGELRIIVHKSGYTEIKAEKGLPSDIFFIRGIMYAAMSKIEMMTTTEVIRRQVDKTIGADDK